MLEKILGVVNTVKEKLRSDLIQQEQEQEKEQAATNYALQNQYAAQVGAGVSNSTYTSPVTSTGIPQYYFPQNILSGGPYSIGSPKVDLDFCVDMIMAAVQKSFQEQLPDIIREVVREEINKALMERANEPGT